MSKRRVAVLLAASAMAVALLAGVAWAEGASTMCSGVQLYPGDDLSLVAAAHAPGTTYCINDGNYSVASNIVVQDGDTFSGVYLDTTHPAVSTTTAEHIFHTQEADNVTITGLSISGAVHDNACEPDCGRAIGGGGQNLLVENVRAHHNENQGIGGTDDGLVVLNSTFDHNGDADSAMDGGLVSAAGIKSVNSMFIYNSRFTDNYWAGVWCDIECGAFEVHDSYFSGNGKTGIADEISSGPALFEGNTIQNNGMLPTANRHTGLLIVDSRNVKAYNNTFGGNAQYGVQAAQTGRAPGIGNVSIYANTMNGDALTGCSISGVNCETNE
jgi:Right handed beta helix region